MTRRAMSYVDRRAMADALRHMHHAGVRRIDLKQTSRLTHRQVHQAISFVVLPGRDGIGGPLTADVVTPRHDASSTPGDLLPVNLAGRDGLSPVAPVIFAGAHPLKSGDGVEQGGAGETIGGFGHTGSFVAPAKAGRVDVPSASSACHGAAGEGSAP